MLWQDAGQTNTWWFYGELPKPVRIPTTGGDYWLVWRLAPIIAGAT